HIPRSMLRNKSVEKRLVDPFCTVRPDVIPSGRLLIKGCRSFEGEVMALWGRALAMWLDFTDRIPLLRTDGFRYELCRGIALLAIAEAELSSVVFEDGNVFW